MRLGQPGKSGERLRCLELHAGGAASRERVEQVEAPLLREEVEVVPPGTDGRAGVRHLPGDRGLGTSDTDAIKHRGHLSEAQQALLALQG